MTCAQCGAADDGGRFCTNCGTPRANVGRDETSAGDSVGSAAPGSTGDSGWTEVADHNDVTSSGKSKVLPAVLGGIVVFALVIGAFAFFLIGGSDAPDPAKASAPAPAATSSSNGGSAPAQSGSSPGGATSTTTSSTPEATAPATMPDLKGKTETEAKALLPGVKVTTTTKLDENTADGSVLDQKPAAGEKTPGEVSLTIAEQAAVRYVDELDPVGSDRYSTGGVTLRGKQYTHGLHEDISCYSEGRTTAYNLGTHYQRLLATVGQADDASTSDKTLLVEIMGDQKRLWSQKVPFGSSVPIDIPVTGVLRLEIKVTSPECSDSGTTIAFGDPRLLGKVGEVPTPTDEQTP